MTRPLPYLLAGFLAATALNPFLRTSVVHAETGVPCVPAAQDTTGTVDAGLADPSAGGTAQTDVVASETEASATEQAASGTDAAPVPDYPLSPILSELFPDPEGDDSIGEFLELSNSHDVSIDLTGWSVRDQKGASWTVPSATIPPDGHLMFTYAETKLRQVNTGGGLSLLDPTGRVRSETNYASPVPTGKSWSRLPDGWAWSAPTPGAANVAPSPAPVAANEPPPNPATQPPAPAPETAAATSVADVRFLRLMPNPDGDDAAEWIELENRSAETATLDGWRLRDLSGASFRLDGKRLDPGASLRLMRAETRLSLNNSEETVFLEEASGSVRDTASYEDAPSGIALVRNGDGGWRWDMPDEPLGAGMEEVAESSSAGAAIENGAISETPDGDAAETVSIGELGAFENGDSVTVEAVVTAAPGTLGKTTFALQDADGGAGAVVRIYGSAAAPRLQSGDRVMVAGRLKRDVATRLSTTAREIQILGRAERLEPVDRYPADLEAGDSGMYVRLVGTVAARGKKWITVGDEDGVGEVVARFAGNAPDLAEGAKVAVIGIVKPVGQGAELAALSAETMEAPTEPGNGDTWAATSENKGNATSPVEGRAWSAPVLEATGGAMPWLALLGALAAAAALFWYRRDAPLPELGELQEERG